MYIVHVFIEVKPDCLDAFIEATNVNVKASVKEQGIARFDFLREIEDPNRFVLVEVYRTKEDTARHKATEHYQKWNNLVEEMMALPRTKKVYENILPDEKGWG